MKGSPDAVPTLSISIRREILAGLTTFAAMAYILVVNPGMLSSTGMDRGALVTATALAAATGSLLMALFTRYPIALAPGMGLNAYFTYSICGQLGIPWQGALSLVFWTGVLFLFLTLTPLRGEIVRGIPGPLKIGIQAGIGLFIVVIGLKNLGLVADPAPGWIALRFASPESIAVVALGVAGLLLAVVLQRFRIAGSLLIVIAMLTVIGLFVPSAEGPLTSRPDSLVSAPPSLAPLWLEIDWWYPFRHWESVWIVLCTLFFVDLFDSLGTLIGVSRLAGLQDEDGNLPKMKEALLADAAATTIGACFGSSTTTAYVESATGVRAGGRTGWTAVVVSVCFLASLCLYPLIAAVPSVAIVPALLLVGGLMMAGLRSLAGEAWQAIVGATVIVIAIPLQFQIAEGIATGLVVYTLLMLFSGKARELHWILIVLSGLFLATFVGEIVTGGEG